MITDNIVMWETRLSVVDWIYSKTQISLETLKIRYQLRREPYVSKRQCLTVPQNRKLFL